MNPRTPWLLAICIVAGCGTSIGNGGGAYLALDAHGDTDGGVADTGKSDAVTGDVSKSDAAKAEVTSTDVATDAGTVGAACAGDGDCTGFPGLSCFKKVDAVPAVGFPGMTWPSGYCSKACSDTDQDCGPEGSCSQSGSGGGQTSYKMQYCAKSCKSDEACRVSAGYKCQIVLMGWGICVPGTP